ECVAIWALRGMSASAAAARRQGGLDGCRRTRALKSPSAAACNVLAMRSRSRRTERTRTGGFPSVGASSWTCSKAPPRGRSGYSVLLMKRDGTYDPSPLADFLRRRVEQIVENFHAVAPASSPKRGLDRFLRALDEFTARRGAASGRARAPADVRGRSGDRLEVAERIGVDDDDPGDRRHRERRPAATVGSRPYQPGPARHRAPLVRASGGLVASRARALGV